MVMRICKTCGRQFKVKTPANYCSPTCKLIGKRKGYLVNRRKRISQAKHIRSLRVKHHIANDKAKRRPWLMKFLQSYPNIRACEICGYDLLYEIHHFRKAITFNQKMALKNMILVCPNCHMLFHRKMLSLEEILKIYNKTLRDIFYKRRRLYVMRLRKPRIFQ